MRHATLVVPMFLAGVTLLAGCATSGATETIVFRSDSAPAPAVQPIDPLRSRPQPVPASDVPESRRQEWWRENQPVPPRPPSLSQELAPRVRVETVRVTSRESDRWRDDALWRDAWWPSLALSVGWWSRAHHGWRWGLGWDLSQAYGYGRPHVHLRRRW